MIVNPAQSVALPCDLKNAGRTTVVYEQYRVFRERIECVEGFDYRTHSVCMFTHRKCSLGSQGGKSPRCTKKPRPARTLWENAHAHMQRHLIKPLMCRFVATRIGAPIEMTLCACTIDTHKQVVPLVYRQILVDIIFLS